MVCPLLWCTPNSSAHFEAAAEQIGAVESVKAASDIFAPVSGAISEINDALEASPGLLNQSPEADGTSFFLPRELTR